MSRTEHTNHDVLLITLLGIAHGVSHFFHLVIPPLFPWLMPLFDLSYAEVGLVMTSFFVVSSIGQATSGFLVDKWGAKRSLMLGVALLTASGVVLALAQSYAWLFVSAILAGLGNSVFHPADYSIINRQISEERLPYAFSIHSVVGNIGWAVAPVMMVGIATVTDWHYAAWASAAMGAAVFALLVVYREAFKVGADSKKDEKKSEGKGGSSFAFLFYAPVWLCFLFFLFTCLAFGILQNFAPSIFKATYQMSLEAATSGLTSYLVGSGIGILMGGWTAKQFKKTSHVIAASLMFAALMAIVLATEMIPAWMVLPVMFLMGMGVGIATPSRDLLIRKTAMLKFGANTFGRVYGFVYCGMDVGQTLSPLVAGTMLDAGLFSMALVFVAVFQTLAVLTALGVGRGD